MKRVRQQFVIEFHRGHRPRYWMHILVAERAYDRATALVQLFAGPGGLPFPYLVDLGMDPARIAAPRERQVRMFAMEPVAGLTALWRNLRPRIGFTFLAHLNSPGSFGANASTI